MLPPHGPAGLRVNSSFFPRQVPLARDIFGLIGPNAGLGFAIGKETRSPSVLASRRIRGVHGREGSLRSRGAMGARSRLEWVSAEWGDSRLREQTEGGGGGRTHRQGEGWGTADQRGLVCSGHRHGRFLYDAHHGAPGGPAPHLRVRECLCHRRCGLLHGLCRGYVGPGGGEHPGPGHPGPGLPVSLISCLPAGRGAGRLILPGFQGYWTLGQPLGHLLPLKRGAVCVIKAQ